MKILNIRVSLVAMATLFAIGGLATAEAQRTSQKQIARAQANARQADSARQIKALQETFWPEWSAWLRAHPHASSAQRASAHAAMHAKHQQELAQLIARLHTRR